ncbi:MAG: zeta toxin family protein [Candidatus Poseidoniaceae archaeon]|jgi:2-phosphoglycerate kinase|nr:zeta toxin family protein [Candidatus Poseidoniaceae archaeon]
MAKQIGIAEATTTKVTGKPPLLVLIAGATGVGKSTTAVKLAHLNSFSRLLSTDAIREIMRVMDNDGMGALHRSSFSKGDSGDPVLDWQDTCKAVEPGILATIERARREGIDLILEGVHLEPSSRLLRTWTDSGGIAIGIVMHVEDENLHTNFLKQRESHSFRNAERYISALPRIRSIQESLKEKAKIADWNLLDVTRVKESQKRIKHWMDIAWNDWRKEN